MKYCKKCGMLLEDTHEHCIRCGADVTIAENVSMYPIEVMETIEEENQRKRASGKIAAMIIALVVVLVGLVLFFLYGLKGNMLKSPADTAEAAPAETAEVKTAEAEEAAEPAAEPTETPTPTPEPSSKKIKDDKGFYYDYVTEKDDAGNVVFTAVVPEDLKQRDFYKDYQGYCDRYPFSMNYTASTEENDVRFTYLSPKKLWYKLSDTGKGRSDEADITHYMTYFKYDGDRSYLDPLLAQSYPGAKFEIKDEYDVTEDTVARLEELAKARNKELFGDIGDLAYIGEGTTYANMDYEFSAKVYEYEITLKDKDMLFCKYFVPSMALNLTYANADTNDRGNITEWYNFAIICFETGNEDEFDDYEEAFNIFIANALPTDMFMYINESYSKDILKAIKDDKDPDPLDETLLKKYASEYKPTTKLDDFDSRVMGILRSAGGVCFAGQDATVYSSDKYKIAYFNKDKSKVFFSPEEDEYPGEDYEELKVQEIPKDAPVADTDDTEAAADEGTEGTDGSADNKSAEEKPESGVN